MGNGTKDTKNIDLIEGRFVDSVINNKFDLDVFDTINNLLTNIKENDSSTKVGEFYGFNFWTMERTLDYFDKYYNKDSKFYKEVMRANNSGDINQETGTIYECKVHIPEITGILPYPDITKIIGATKAKNLNQLPAAVVKSYKKGQPERLAEGFSEILKLAMYPSFFFFSNQAGAPPFGHYCKVKFDESMPTKGIGIYLKSLGSRFK